MICFLNSLGEQVFVNPALVEYSEVKDIAYLVHLTSGKYLTLPKDKQSNTSAFEELLNARGGEA